MGKKGVSKISGIINPKVGEKHTYKVLEWYTETPANTRNSQNVTWELYKKRSNGKFTTTNIKKKGVSDFTFGEKAVGSTYKLQAYLYEPEGGGLIINPRTNVVPKIESVILLNRGSQNVNKAKFNESLTAEARTVGLFRKEITFYLWEEGASESDKYKKPKKAHVDKNGIAKINFNLSEYASSNTLLSFFTGGSETTKKFFVTAVYNNKKTTNKVGVVAEEEKEKPKPKTESGGSIAGTAGEWIESTTKVIAKGIGNIIETFTPEKKKSPAIVKEPPLQKIEESKKGDCFCNRDFTPEEFTKIIHDLRDSETGVKRDSGYNLFAAYNCPLPISDRTIEKLRNKINNLFREYDINTCIRKIHFLAQVYHETDRFRTTLEYATKKSYKPYFGRGLMQLTWESNYKIYKHYSGVDCISNYGQIASKFDLVCDSAGWYWKQGKVLSVGRRWRGPSDAPTYVKAQNPDYPKTTITWNDGDDKIKKYGTVNLGLIADDDKVDLISYLVNGGANGLQERRNYVFTLKSIFKYPQECVNKKTSKNETSSTPNDKVTIRLVRKWETSNSTIGEFTIDNTDIKGYFLEEKGPDTTVSGIEQRVPIGTYNLEWHSGSKIKKGLKLYNDVVSKSRAILIHSGNTANDTEGCLIAGSSKSKDFVGGSRAKLKEIFDYVEEIGIEGSKIIITQAYE